MVEVGNGREWAGPGTQFKRPAGLLLKSFRYQSKRIGNVTYVYTCVRMHVRIDVCVCVFARVCMCVCVCMVSVCV